MSETTRRRLLGVTAAGMAALAGCGGGDGGDEYVEEDTVDMTDANQFDPSRIEVEVGTTVTWENVGNVGHTVTAYDDEIPDDGAYFASGGFDSEDAAADGYPDEGNIAGGESYEHTFETAGEYQYYCIPHEQTGMYGRVRVVE